MDSDSFTIEAKAGDTARPAEGTDAMSRLMLMLQSLLADRFRLSVHRETREEAVYDLVVAKGGPKLMKSEPEGKPQGRRMEWGVLGGTALPVPVLAVSLSQLLERPVIDRTGLKGIYDFTLTWMPDSSQARGFGDSSQTTLAPVPERPSIFTAIQEQLGLELRTARGAVDVLVIDHVEKPDAN